jgi:hypothetical protein
MRMKTALIAISLLVAAALAVALAVALPTEIPKEFIHKNECPYEDCTYGHWKVLKQTHLYGAPKKDGPSNLVVLVGEKVQALTGEIHVVPTRVDVLNDNLEFKKGDVFYITGVLGRSDALGVVEIWQDGRTRTPESDISGLVQREEFRNCKSQPSADCWAQVNGDPNNETWWVKIKTSSNKIGWTDEPKNFVQR